MMFGRRLSRCCALSLFVSSLFAMCKLAAAQQKPPSAQPLGNVLHMVFDEDKDGKVTMTEVNKQLDVLQNVLSGGATDDEGQLYLEMLKASKSAAPKLIQLMDVDGDKSLSKKEF